MNKLHQILFGVLFSIFIATPCLGQFDTMIDSLEELLDLASLDDVQDELELTKKQAKSLIKLLDDGENRLQELLDKKDEAEFPEDAEIASKAITSEFEKIQLKLKDLLLPHQIERLGQIARQSRLVKSQQNQGAFGVLAMAKELNLTADQVSRIKGIVQENEKGFVAEIKQVKSEFIQLREKYRQEVRTKLRTRQRDKFEALVGPEFLTSSWISYWFDLCEADRKFRAPKD